MILQCFFIGLEDGDRLTVFFKSDGFQKGFGSLSIGLLEFKNGFSRISLVFLGLVSHRLYPGKEEVD